ncbi:phospholipase A2 inhibitor and Ly6/PLAUR domain-containing protein-like [Anolis sagrei]|uniref:phospholipase A2 inhibitor and Ly6/PLAUR domain-containing protein-like n=1 Tax=Anolis sagrei TaxID=38937 RepID=UPI00352215B5
MTITMHVLFNIVLKLFLFFVLIATVASLDCEVCESEDVTCSGNWEHCPSDKDVCIYAVVKSTIDGNTSANTVKSCGNLDMCGTPMVVLNMGNETTYMTSLVCCKGQQCRHTFPSAPSKEFVLNGKVCPACYTAFEKCGNKTVACFGSQHFCFDVSTLVKIDGKETAYTMKGCTTESVCASLSSSRSPMLGEAIVTKIECTPDVLHGSASPKLVLLLCYGLLLLKILL